MTNSASEGKMTNLIYSELYTDRNGHECQDVLKLTGGNVGLIDYTSPVTKIIVIRTDKDQQLWLDLKDGILTQGGDLPMDEAAKIFFAELQRIADKATIFSDNSKVNIGLMEENERLRKLLETAEWYYSEDGESYGDVSDAAEDLGAGCYRKVYGGREAGAKYVARVILTRDDDGDPDEVESQVFDTEELAKAALNKAGEV